MIQSDTSFTLDSPVVIRKGAVRNVKNLGWLLRHASEVEWLSAWGAVVEGAYLQAHLNDGADYIAHFNSWNVLVDFTARRCFAHAQREIARPAQPILDGE